MQLFGLIGKKLNHSFSKKYFEDNFAKFKNYDYQLFELEKINDFINLIETKKITGLNVTFPYKEDIIPFLDFLDEEAKKIGAVNCIVFKDNKKIGHNTDAYGFEKSIAPFLTHHHQKALILGSGGAAKAIAHVLNKLGIDVNYVSRIKSKSLVNNLTYEQVNDNIIQSHKLIINCTPLGTFPNQEHPRIPYEFIGKQHFLYDLVYNPEKTFFLEKGRQQGAEISNGLNMLKFQAEKSWKLWGLR